MVSEYNNLSYLTDLIFYIVKDKILTMIFNINFGEIKILAINKKIIPIAL
jgi:hypothetical protein